MISPAGLVQEERRDVKQDEAVRDPLEPFLSHAILNDGLLSEFPDLVFRVSQLRQILFRVCAEPGRRADDITGTLFEFRRQVEQLQLAEIVIPDGPNGP
jgi:hypothetical protein